MTARAKVEADMKRWEIEQQKIERLNRKLEKRAERPQNMIGEKRSFNQFGSQADQQKDRGFKRMKFN